MRRHPLGHAPASSAGCRFVGRRPSYTENTGAVWPRAGARSTWANRIFRPGCSRRSPALAGVPLRIEGEGTLLRRPTTMMIAPLRQLGVEVRHRDGFLPFDVCGPLHSATVEVDGSVSSQFITGLLLALPAARGEFIDVRRAVSTPYIDMTIRGGTIASVRRSSTTATPSSTSKAASATDRPITASKATGAPPPRCRGGAVRRRSDAAQRVDLSGSRPTRPSAPHWYGRARS